jgi:hypothetical protein
MENNTFFTLENEILIAEFWGYKFYPADKWWKFNGYQEHYWIKRNDKPIRRNPKEFRFCFDWNWLHPVIKKILDINNFTDKILIEARQKFYADIKDKLLYDDIEGACNLVVNFIKLYNENKK